MVKIKKIYKYPLLTLSVVIVLLLLLIPVLRIPKVQSWAGNRILEKFSQTIKGDVTIGSLKVTYINRISVSDLLVRDERHDTLIYSPFVRVAIRKLDRKKRLTRIGRIIVEDPVLRLRPDSAGSLNLIYFTNKLVNKDTAKRNRVTSIEQIRVFNGTVSFSNGKTGGDRTAKIDPNNVEVENLNVIIDDLDKLWKRYKMTLSELSFTTSQGFEVQDLFASIEINRDHFYLVDPTLKTSSSIINSSIIGIDFINRDSTFKFTEDASLNFRFDRSTINLSDIAYFLPGLQSANQQFLLSGDLRGTVKELKGRHLDLSYADSTRLIFDIDLSGLPDIENTFMFININRFESHTSELNGFPIPGKGPLELTPGLMALGKVSFTGNFTGFITDFVTYGRFSSDLGDLSTDILFSPDSLNSFVFNGSLSASELQIGKILEKEELLGKLSFNTNVDGTSESFSKFRANLEGTIDRLDFNNYRYGGMNISGLFTENIWDGTLSTATDDLKMDLLGRFDFSGEIPEFDFTLNLDKANLFNLNFESEDSTTVLSALLTASITGNSIENSNGEIRLLNSRLRKHGEDFDLYDGRLFLVNNDSLNRIELNTDYVDASVDGHFDLRNMVSDIRALGAQLMPGLFIREGSLYHISDNMFNFRVNFKNTDPFNDFFRTGLYLNPNLTITGTIDPDSVVTISTKGDYIVYNNNRLLDFNLNTTIHDTVAGIKLQCNKLTLADRIDLNNLSMNLESLPDKIDFITDWNNNSNLRSEGLIEARAIVINDGVSPPHLAIDIHPSAIWMNGSPWEVVSSSITIDSTAIGINGFNINHKDDFFMADGKISEEPGDTLFININGLDLSALNSLRRENSESGKGKIDFIIDGLLGGKLMLTGLYDKPLFETNMIIDDLKTNDHEHGRVKLAGLWNNVDKVVSLSLLNDYKGKNTFNIGGTYNPLNRNIDLGTRLDGFPLDILNLVLKSFASGVSGTGSGKVNISGPVDNLKLEGAVFAKDASMTIDYLQTEFLFSDSIRFSDGNIIFRDILLADNKGNNATLAGKVSHNGFRDFNVDLRIGVDNIKVLDTRAKDNNLFYGTAYASGVVAISGPTNNLGFNISASTGRNTQVFIPLNSGEEVSDYSFIKFISPADSTREVRKVFFTSGSKEESSSIGLNIDLGITPDAEVKLVFNSTAGDVLTARGSGDLNLALDHEGNFSIFGSYTIEDGEYSLTLGNLFNKRFLVEEGGSITWNGDIYDAQVDIKAIYKLSASLYNLLQLESYRGRMPVECHLNMSGNLMNPVIGFDIYLPTADEETRTYLRNAINTQEEMSKQFLYLLVMNSFYADPAYAGATSTATAGASAMGVTTTEMLSNQLSNWLSQISNDFDVGFAYRPGNEISSQEVEVALSTQLLNDRVVINGNVDVGGQESTSKTNNITGDFDVEVKLTDKFRLKVFNRSNDNILYERGAPYTQGFGFFFRKDFNRFSDLFSRERSKGKKEEEPTFSPTEKERK